MSEHNLDRPEGLTPLGDKAYDAVMAALQEKGATNSGGCKVFYSPEEWQERGESYGAESELIVCHDGGAHAMFFNMDYGNYNEVEDMAHSLHNKGVYVEQCTCWYSAIYPL